MTDIIQSRKSVRKFSSKKPDWRNLIEAIDSARYAPMAGNIFSLKFIIISDKEKIKELTSASQQDFFSDVHYVIAVCSSHSLTLNAYPESGKDYIRQQAGAGIQNFLLELESFGLSTCWIGHFQANKIKKILKIPKEADVEAIFPIGYEDKKAKEKRKKKINLDNILYFEEYGNKRMIK